MRPLGNEALSYCLLTQDWWKPMRLATNYGRMNDYLTYGTYAYLCYAYATLPVLCLMSYECEYACLSYMLLISGNIGTRQPPPFEWAPTATGCGGWRGCATSSTGGPLKTGVADETIQVVKRTLELISRPAHLFSGLSRPF